MIKQRASAWHLAEVGGMAFEAESTAGAKAGGSPSWANAEVTSRLLGGGFRDGSRKPVGVSHLGLDVVIGVSEGNMGLNIGMYPLGYVGASLPL